MVKILVAENLTYLQLCKKNLALTETTCAVFWTKLICCETKFHDVICTIYSHAEAIHSLDIDARYHTEEIMWSPFDSD